MLMQEALLYRQEAPGNTCMDSLRELYRHKRRMPNDSKGNGTIMRCFPLVPFITADNLEQLVSDCVYSTHDHVFAFWATKIAVLIGKALSAGLRLQRLLDVYGKHLYMMGLKHPRDVAHASQYGGGWVAEEALGIALWALWNGKGDWLTTIELAVVHPGDSDSTGAVAGGFLGCIGVMPPLELQSRLEALGVIERLLAHYPQGDGKDSNILISAPARGDPATQQGIFRWSAQSSRGHQSACSIAAGTADDGRLRWSTSIWGPTVGR